MPVLNNQTVFDKYDDRCTIEQVYPLPNAGGWFVLAQNGNSAYVEVQYGPEYGTVGWTQEQVLGSGAYGTIPRNASGIRFRNAVAGKAQQVTVFLGFADEPALGINNLGTVNVVTGATLNFQLNDVFVAAEPTVDFEAVANQIGWTVVDDTPNTRVKVTPTVAAAFVFPGSAGTGGAAAGAGGVAGNLLVATGGLNVTGTLAATTALTTSVVGDTQLRYQLTADGKMQWGGGVAALDTTLGRSAAGQLDLGTTAQAGKLRLFGAAAATLEISTFVTTDANPRFTLQADGGMAWGPGSAGTDTTLQRASAAVLATAGSFAWGSMTSNAVGTGPGGFLDTTGRVLSVRTANSSPTLGLGIVGDTFWRYAVDATGLTSWSLNGTAAAVLNIGLANRGSTNLLDITGTTPGIANGGTPNSLAQAGWAQWSAVMTMVGTAAANNTYLGGIQGEATYRWRITADGQFSIGGGAVATDTTISRTAAGVLNVTNVVTCGAIEPGFVTTTFSTSGNTYTPNYALQAYHQIVQTVTAAATITIANPTNEPTGSLSGWLAFRIVNNGTGSLAVTWGTHYAQANAVTLPNSIANATTVYLFFIWNANAGLWHLFVKD